MHQIIEVIAILQIDAVLFEIAGAAQVNDHKARHLKGDLRAVSEPKNMDGQVYAGGNPGAGEDPAGLHEEDARLTVIFGYRCCISSISSQCVAQASPSRMPASANK